MVHLYSNTVLLGLYGNKGCLINVVIGCSVVIKIILKCIWHINISPVVQYKTVLDHKQ